MDSRWEDTENANQQLLLEAQSLPRSSRRIESRLVAKIVVAILNQLPPLAEMRVGDYVSLRCLLISQRAGKRF
jgi:hypothetical protein